MSRHSAAPEVWVIRIVWSKEYTTGPIGPIIGSTRCNELMTVMRKRLRANKRPFVRIYRELVRTPQTAFGWDALRDSIDDLLSSVFYDSGYYLETGDAVLHLD